MWITMVIGSGMTLGGILMHRAIEGEWYPPFIDLLLVRELHNKMAVPFALSLGIMMLTGLLMWGVPKILGRRKT